MSIVIALYLFVTSSLLLIHQSSAQTGGFTATLYHRDSKFSPLYDPALSETERLARSLARDSTRLRSLACSSARHDLRAQVANSDGAFLMNISLGTPPFTITGVADTGSDLIWTQCNPCQNCFKQKLPRFNPAMMSSTYRTIPCDNTCPYREDCTVRDNCSYTVKYVDGSHTKGVILSDTLTMNSWNGEVVALPNSIFGCGNDNDGIFTGNESGVIGLGLGSESLVSQLGLKKFSYCLPLMHTSGFINFGENAVVSGIGVVTTPMMMKESSNHHYLILKGFTVDGEKVDFTEDYGHDEGNMLIDSGAHFTYLPINNYYKFEDAVKRHISAEPLKHGGSNLCYSGANFSPPTITANFKGADVELKSYNTFESVKLFDCLAFLPETEDLFGIYGTVAQTNFLIGYDLVRETVSFKSMDCA